jgi:adenylylsulfate kinase-like enzyme
VNDAAFTVWVTGAEPRMLHDVADDLASRLAARRVRVEMLDARTPGLEILAGDVLEQRIAFVAGLLAHHGVAVVVALPGSRRGRDGARARLGRMIEVHVRAAVEAPTGGYEAPERAEVEVVAGRPPAGLDHVLPTLEVLNLLSRAHDRSDSADEEREVIRRLKSFGYL